MRIHEKYTTENERMRQRQRELQILNEKGDVGKKRVDILGFKSGGGKGDQQESHREPSSLVVSRRSTSVNNAPS